MVMAGIIAGLYVVAGVVAFVTLTILGKDPSNFVMFFAGLLTTGLPQLFTLMKVHSTQQDVAAVKETVDNNVSEKT